MTQSKRAAEMRAIKAAVHLLREDAQSTYDSCKGTETPWVCGGFTCPNCPARREYRARIKVANQLESTLARQRKGRKHG